MNTKTQTASSASAAAKKETQSAKNGQSKSTASKGKQKSLETMFEDGLKDIYSAEEQLVEALPKMAEAAEEEELKEAFEEHLEQTKKHVKRLDKIFERLNISSTSLEKCKAMEGLIEEDEDIIKEYPEGAVRDAALIIGAQKVEHYEIASYGSLCELAEVLGFTRIAELLDTTLEEEEETDLLLTEIAREVNDNAYEQMSDEDEKEEGEEEEEDDDDDDDDSTSTSTSRSKQTAAKGRKS